MPPLSNVYHTIALLAHCFRQFVAGVYFGSVKRVPESNARGYLLDEIVIKLPYPPSLAFLKQRLEHLLFLGRLFHVVISLPRPLARARRLW